jgi:flagellin-like hook-associated protein FlgL
MLGRVRDLAVQFNNGTLSAQDKTAITAEVAQLCAEISRISSQTKFNGISLLSGGVSITFQIGDDDGRTLRSRRRTSVEEIAAWAGRTGRLLPAALPRGRAT